MLIRTRALRLEPSGPDLRAAARRLALRLAGNLGPDAPSVAARLAPMTAAFQRLVSVSPPRRAPLRIQGASGLGWRWAAQRPVTRREIGRDVSDLLRRQLGLHCPALGA